MLTVKMLKYVVPSSDQRFSEITAPLEKWSTVTMSDELAATCIAAGLAELVIVDEGASSPVLGGD